MERLYQLALVLVAVGLTALGPSVGPVALVGAVACVIILAVSLARSRWQLRQRPDAVAVVESAAVSPVAEPDRPRLDPAALYGRPTQQARLLRQGAEAPAKQIEREAIQDDARQVSRTYRAMHRINGIDGTSTSDRVKMLERVIALQRRRDAYLDTWTVVVPQPGSFLSEHTAVWPSWLDAMAQDADVIAWQLDNEDSAPMVAARPPAQADPEGAEGTKHSLLERRAAVRDVRTSITDTMVSAEKDRDHGDSTYRNDAIASANVAASIVLEVADDDARRLVREWKTRFDTIQKGWKEGGPVDLYSDEQLPPGYPEPDWSELKRASAAALDRLGAVLRAMLS